MAISVAALEERLSDVQVRVLREGKDIELVPAQASPREVFQNYRHVIPPWVRSKLASRKATGDRSRVLWKINCQLAEAGLSRGEIVVLVEQSVWNKFGEDRSRLWADVKKAYSGSSNGGPQDQRKHSKTRSSPWSIAVDEYLSVESKDPQWMIDGLWSDKSHGIIAGEPKTRKSYIAIDIALSVATRTKCLGHFDVVKPGSVLMIQEEISDAEMRKRLRHIAVSKGLGGEITQTSSGITVRLPDPIPLYLRNRKGCDLSSNDTFRELEREVLDKSIKLLILDPLQLMLGNLDENRASDVRPVLYNFLQLKEATGCGVMIVHHYSKASATNPRVGGQRMLGSQAFHGWVESGLYMSKPDHYVTHVEREFRNFEPIAPFDVEYLGGDEGYEVIVAEKARSKRPKPTQFELFCLRHDGIAVKRLAIHLQLDERTIKSRVEKSLFLSIGKGTTKTGRPQMVVIKKRTRE